MKCILMILLLTVLQGCVTHAHMPAAVDVHVHEGRHYPVPRHCPPGHAKKGWC